jgi:hypothetical protein
MNDLINTLRELLSKITLERDILFGFVNQKITIFITPTIQIFRIVAEPKSLLKTFPFDEGQPLNLSKFVEYIESNKWEVSIHAKSPLLKRKLSDYFDDKIIIESSQKSQDIEVALKVIENVEHSHIPDSIKKWAKNNPEKFLEHLKEVEKILNS